MKIHETKVGNRPILTLFIDQINRRLKKKRLARIIFSQPLSNSLSPHKAFRELSDGITWSSSVDGICSFVIEVNLFTCKFSFSYIVLTEQDCLSH